MSMIAASDQSGLSIFATMGKLCRDYSAVNLSQGCPDFPCDPYLIELVYKSMKDGFNQYSPMEGVLPLREAISEKIFNSYNSYYNPASEVTITTGATEGVYAAIKCVVKQGDEVIIFQPAFDSYVAAVKMAGGIPVLINLEPPGYRIPWEQVRQKITPLTKLLIINSPHNPTGTLISLDDIHQLEKLVLKHNVIVLSDEVYEHIVFDGQVHYSIAASKILRSKSFILFSFGKTFHTTGWRIGYCLAPAILSHEFRKAHQYITFSAPTPMQHALAEYIKIKEKYLSIALYYQQKRDLFLDKIRQSRFTFIPSKGTYFQLVSFNKISADSEMNFSYKLVKEHKVASIPLSPFYQEVHEGKTIRFCFAKKEETLIEAAEKLCRI